MVIGSEEREKPKGVLVFPELIDFVYRTPGAVLAEPILPQLGVSPSTLGDFGDLRPLHRFLRTPR